MLDSRHILRNGKRCRLAANEDSRVAGSLPLGRKIKNQLDSPIISCVSCILAICTIFTSASFVMNGMSQVKIGKNISTEPKVGKMKFDYLTILNKGKFFHILNIIIPND